MIFKPINYFPLLGEIYKDIYGWQQAAQRAVALKKQYQADTFWMMNWTHASRIAWYSYPHAIQITGSKQTQFDLWYGKRELQDAAILIALTGGKKNMAGSECRLVDEYNSQLKNITINHFYYYYCQPLLK